MRVFAAGPRSGSQPGDHEHDDDDDHDNFDYARMNIPDSLQVEGGGGEEVAGVGSRPVHLVHKRDHKTENLFISVVVNRKRTQLLYNLDFKLKGP